MNILVAISISFGIAFIVWKVIVKKGKAKSTRDYVLKWLATGLCMVIAGSLPRVLMFGGEKNYGILLAGLIIFVPLFALVGWIVGKLSKLKVKNVPQIISEKTSKLVKGVTDDVHGAKLFKGLSANLEKLAEMDDKFFDQAVSAFISKRVSLRADMKNMSSKGCIQTAQQLQAESKKMADLDKSGSCALWLAGAWLESLHRASDKAQYVHESLDDVTEDNFPLLDRIIEGSVLTLDMPDITKCEPIKQTEVGEFTVVLMKDVPAINDSLKLIEYFFVMALISNKTNLPVYFVTSEAVLNNDSAFLCHFSPGGIHINHGNDLDYKDIKVFSKAASKIIKSEMPDSYAFSS